MHHQPQPPPPAIDAPQPELTAAQLERHLHAALERIRHLGDRLAAETRRADQAERERDQAREERRALLLKGLDGCRTRNRSRWSDDR